MHFIDEAAAHIPEFDPDSAEIEELREQPSSAVGHFALWLRDRIRDQDRNQDLLRRACAFLNEAASRSYTSQDIQNDIAVSFFWCLDYPEIKLIAPFLSEEVLEIGRSYLHSVDGENFQPF
jgi:hypothetical protein